jgi:3-hydroxyacyl-CoA dehydrogenase
VSKAACFAAGGWNVRIRDPSAAQREAALDYIRQNIGTYTAITRRKSGSWEAVEDLPLAVKDAWLVIEAVPEKLEIKLSTFADLEKYAPKDCILATNSSSYKSGELVGRVSDDTKKRVLNTHFMVSPIVLLGWP